MPFPLAGVCLRLQRLVERAFPAERIQERRREVEARAAEASARRQQQQQLAASVQALMRARMAAMAASMQQGQAMQATAAGSPSSPSPASPSSPAAAPRAWHSAQADAPMRHCMAQRLVELLHGRRPAMTETCRARLPSLVRKLEEGLYCAAGSREQYADAGTLVARVQRLVGGLSERRRAGSPTAAASLPPQL